MANMIAPTIASRHTCRDRSETAIAATMTPTTAIHAVRE